MTPNVIMAIALWCQPVQPYPLGKHFKEAKAQAQDCRDKIVGCLEHAKETKTEWQKCFYSQRVK